MTTAGHCLTDMAPIDSSRRQHVIAEMARTPSAGERTRQCLRRVLVCIVWLSAVAFWGALAACYLADASPLAGFEVSLRWSRAGETPAPSHRAQGHLRVGP